jgi:hypothetical protein
MKHILIIASISAAATLFIICAGCKQPEQTVVTKWRTRYVRDTSTALCNRITNADSAIAFMDHLFVPLYRDKGIQFNNPLGQSIEVWIPGIESKNCKISDYYCPDYLIDKDIEIAFSLFSYPSQLQEWRNLNEHFIRKNKEWRLSLQFRNIYCAPINGFVIKNGKITKAW